MYGVERFRSVEWLIVVPFGSVFGIVLFVAFAVQGTWTGVVVAGVVEAGFLYFLLFAPFDVTIGSDHLVTFRALARQKCFYAEDVRRIERVMGKTADGGGPYLKVEFVGGSTQFPAGDAGKRLARRLCELNPRIETNFDPFAGNPRRL